MRVRGTMKIVPEVEVNVDTVYIRKNIDKINEDDFTGWEYDEVQIPLREYIKYISSLGQSLTEGETMLILQGQQLTDLELSILGGLK